MIRRVKSLKWSTSLRFKAQSEINFNRIVEERQSTNKTLRSTHSVVHKPEDVILVEVRGGY